MSVRLYAVAREGATAPGSSGADGEPLRIVAGAGLAALVGTTGRTGAAPVSEAALWRHEQAVEALMSCHDVLPARFGTTLESDSKVRALLIERGEDFDAALAHVAGAVEVGVRAALVDELPADQGDRAASGTAYLQVLKHRDELAREIAARIGSALRPFSRDSRIGSAWGSSGTIASAHLVARETVGAFRERAQALARETEFAQLVCTGPWPPYSFVAAGEQP